MQLDFEALIAPLTPAEISALRLERVFRIQHSAGDNRFAALFDWSTLWNLIEHAVIPADKVRVSRGRRIVPPLFYSDDGRLNAGRLARLFEQGASLIVRHLDAYAPQVDAICRDAAATLGIPMVEAGAVVTSGNGGALVRHYDWYDLVILQLEGSKRWRLYGPLVSDPMKAMATKNPPRTEPILDVVLGPGDILFMPAGFWHECDNGPGRSLHLGLFLNSPPVDPTTFG